MAIPTYQFRSSSINVLSAFVRTMPYIAHMICKRAGKHGVNILEDPKKIGLGMPFGVVAAPNQNYIG